MTLFNLCKELLLEIGDNSPHKLARFIQYGIAGLREFSLDFSGGAITTVSLTVNANGTADLPSDYIRYRRIAVCDSDGNLHDLGWNPDMCPLAPDDCGALTEVAGTNGLIAFGYSDNDFRNGEVLGRQFGLGGGNNTRGYYKIDETNGFIVLQNFTGDNVWLEYVADLKRNSNGEFEVHPYIVTALKAFIRWQKEVNATTTYSSNRETMSYQNFSREKTKAVRRFQSFTLQEAKDIGRRTFTPSPKF